MNDLDQEILQTFVEESREHLADVESELLKAEASPGQTPAEVINQVFRCVHSIKGGAGFLGLERIKELSHQLENVVGLMREGHLAPSSQTITVLLLATDRLRELVEDVDHSNLMEIAPMLAALQEVLAPAPTPEPEPAAGQAAAPETEPAPPDGPATETGGTLEVSAPGGQVRLLAPLTPLALELETGSYIYLVEFNPADDPRLAGQDAAQVLPDIAQGGVILAVSDATAGPGAPDLPGGILFASVLDPDIIPGLLPVENRFIHNLTGELRDRIAELGPGPQEEAPAPEAALPEEAAAPLTPNLIDLAAQDRPPRPNPEKTPAAPGVSEPEATPQAAEKGYGGASLRVHVSLLDRLMTLAGELVLGRNQLLQTLNSQDIQAVRNVAQKVNLVTSELQETVMLTRMQPVSLVFNKFPRVVRDLARSLGKEVALVLEGEEVELDKTIIEGLHDPLTHLVRNAVDHGIEPPQVRRQAGKRATGQLLLKAYHQAGQVILEIRDDGKGLDHVKLGEAAVAKGWLTVEQNRSMSEAERLNLVFLPGFSTAEKVTEVSGRGVGLDVVKSNLDKVGGQVEIDSRVGEGTTFIIKLPLTLAIIPSLIVSTAGERFAIPQVNVQELLRVPATQVRDRLETVGDAVVVRLRGQLLPLLPLAEVMGLVSCYLDLHDHALKPDRRHNLADRRSRANPAPGEESDSPPPPEAAQAPESWENQRQGLDRRYHAASALCIAVVGAGPLRYGLVVDTFHGAEEIVFKPLGSHHKSCRTCAGATIMGDGRVALVLDIANLAALAGLTSLAGTGRAEELDRQAAAQKLADVQSLLLFHQAEAEIFAVPLFLVQRLEKIKAGAVETLGGQKVIQHQGGSLPIFALDDALQTSPLNGREDLLVIVLNAGGREVGLLAAPPVDTVEMSLEMDSQTLKQTGVMGSAIIHGRTTLLLDIYEFLEQLKPDWFKDRPRVPETSGQAPLILLAEDSTFFRGQVKRFLSETGYQVADAEDGLAAWELLQKHGDKVQLVVTDIEMPNLDGLGLTARIRADQRFRHLPIIAVTSLAGEEDEARGRQAGVDDYQIKLDREQLLAKVGEFLKRGAQP
jgi:two-component system chemotaxis sensor kinase CheA